MMTNATICGRSTARWLLMAAGLALFAGTASATPIAIPTTGGPVSSGFSPLSTFSSNPIDIGFQLDFYGKQFNQLYINGNGNVTFGSGLSDPTPFGFGASTTTPIIAPFFADASQFGPTITYGQGTYQTHQALVVNWPGAFTCGTGNDLTNMFQLLLVNRPDTGHQGNFDIRFNYELQCPNTDYLGPIDIGFSNGSGNGFTSTYYQVSQSGVQSAYTNYQTVDYTGGFLFEVRGDPPPTESVPEPATVALMGLGLLTLARLRHRRSRIIPPPLS